MPLNFAASGSVIDRARRGQDCFANWSHHPKAKGSELCQRIQEV